MTYPARSFEDLADLFRRMASAVDVLTRDFGPEWVPDSPAHLDSQHEPGFAGDWGERPLETGVMYVPSLLSHSADHMRALAASLDADNVVMATYSLLRPIIDSSARVAYLLEPGIDAKERLRRGTNMRLLSYSDELALAEGTPGAADALAYYTGMFSAIGRGARPLGLSLTTPKARDGYRKAPYLGRQHPSEMALAEAVLGRTDAGIGRTTYRVASAFVHGRPHAWRFMDYDVIRRTSPGTLAARFGARLDNYTVVAAAPVLALNQAALDATANAGYPTTVWTDLAQPILRVWQASLHQATRTRNEPDGQSDQSDGA